MFDPITEVTPSDQRIRTLPGKTDPTTHIQFVSIGIITAVLIGSPIQTQSKEQLLKVTALHPATTISLLTAPQIGKKICDIASSTSIKFFNRANHGPHKFARVEILEGACAGEQGYVAWVSLDPQPPED
jgi:hypothetical protein